MNDTLMAALPMLMVLGPLAIMASRTFAPMKARPEGKVLLEVRLPFLQRALSQRANVIAVCAVVTVAGGALTSQRVVSPALSLLALFAMLLMLLKRQTLVFTSRGVMPHSAAFRSWRDFDGYRVGANKLVLRSSTKLASVSLFFPSHSRDDVLDLVKRQLGAGRDAAPSRRAVNRRRGRTA